MAVMRFSGTALVDGVATGTSLTTDTPLSFWGGVDPHTGEIIDRRHPLFGASIAQRVLVLPSGRGSCSASGVLLEAIANGTAPAGIIVSEVDPIIGLGAILGDELLGRTVPVFLLTTDERIAITDATELRMLIGGSIEFRGEIRLRRHCAEAEIDELDSAGDLVTHRISSGRRQIACNVVCANACHDRFVDRILDRGSSAFQAE